MSLKGIDQRRFELFLQVFNRIDREKFGWVKTERVGIGESDETSRRLMSRLGIPAYIYKAIAPTGVPEDKFNELLRLAQSDQIPPHDQREAVGQLNADIENFEKVLQAFRRNDVNEPYEPPWASRKVTRESLIVPWISDKFGGRFSVIDVVRRGGPVVLNILESVSQSYDGGLLSTPLLSSITWGLANFWRVHRCRGCFEVFVQRRSNNFYCNDDCKNANNQRNYYQRHTDQILTKKRSYYVDNRERILGDERANRKKRLKNA